MQSHHTLSYDQQNVSDIACFCEGQSHHILSYDYQVVSDIAHFVKSSLITSFQQRVSDLHILWMAVSSHLFLYQQLVSDIAHFGRTVWSYLLLWPTASEWDYTSCERQPHHIFSYDQQKVSEIVHFVKGSLITPFPMTNRKWVRLHILWMAVLSHHFLWQKECEWDCTCCERPYYDTCSYDQQNVSEIAHVVKSSFITSFLMTNSLWVRLHILWRAVLSHRFLWCTGCEWDTTFCERQPFAYDQQKVSDIAPFVKGSLMTSFPMTNRQWVTLHILWMAVSPHAILWPTECEWHCTFLKESIITSFPMTNSMWVTLHMWKAVSSHFFLSPTACESHGTCCERQSHHNISYDQQLVSEIAHFVKGIHVHCFWWPTGCEWHGTFCERQSHHTISYYQQHVSEMAHFVKDSLITSFPMTNRKWVRLHILWKAVSSHLSIVCEWDCTFC